MPRVMVTGGTGFIGSHLVKRLQGESFEVHTSNTSSGDVADDATWERYPDADIVVHLAGKTFVPDSWADPAGFIRTNLAGTLCALGYCRKRGARLIYLSAYLYGAPKVLPIPESAALEPNNPYALSKKLAEDACRFYSQYYGIDVTILRPFNIYGPRQDAKFLIPSIIQQVLSGLEIRVQDLEPRRDYVYIEDVTEALLCAVGKPQRFDVFNIASGTSHSVGEVIELVQALAGTRLPVHCEGKRRDQEIMDTRADVVRARDALDWRPRWSLRDGLAKIMRDAKRA